MIQHYAYFRQRFADALDPAWQSITEIDEKVRTDDCLMWADGETALLCEIRDLPMGPVLFGLVCCGDMEVLRSELQPLVEQTAKDIGCKGIAFCGRVGWARAMPDYKVVQIVALKEF